MKENLFEVAFIIDQSGSMEGKEEETLLGYNQLLEKNKEKGNDICLSTILFNHQYTILHNRVDINQVSPITNKDYQACGYTALYDAVGHTINEIGKLLAETEESQRPAKVIIIIITDGMENASTTFDKKTIKEMIELQKAKYNWEFLFLGANFDAEEFAETIGINEDRAVQYEDSNDAIKSNFAALSQFISDMAVENIGDGWKKDIIKVKSAEKKSKKTAKKSAPKKKY